MSVTKTDAQIAVSKQAVNAVVLTVFAVVMAVGVDPVLAWLALAGRMSLLYVYTLYGFALALLVTIWVWRKILYDPDKVPVHKHDRSMM